jgi:hypothetical protein
MCFVRACMHRSSSMQTSAFDESQRTLARVDGWTEPQRPVVAQRLDKLASLEAGHDTTRRLGSRGKGWREKPSPCWREQWQCVGWGYADEFDWISAREKKARKCARAHACTYTHGAHGRVRTRARTNCEQACPHAHMHTLHPTAQMDRWPGFSIGTHAYAHSLSLSADQTLPNPHQHSIRTHMHTHSPRHGAWILASRRLCRTPAKRRPPVRQASPPPPKGPPHWCKGARTHARTHARSPLIRPPAIAPATLPHARRPAAPPVSWQDVAPPRCGPRHPHAFPLPRPSLTDVVRAPVHVELAPRRREAVSSPGRRRFAFAGGGEVCPGPGGRIVHVQVVEGTWTGWIRDGGVNVLFYACGLRACGCSGCTHGWLPQQHAKLPSIRRRHVD